MNEFTVSVRGQEIDNRHTRCVVEATKGGVEPVHDCCMNKFQIAPAAYDPRIVENLTLNFAKVTGYEPTGASHEDTWRDNF